MPPDVPGGPYIFNSTFDFSAEIGADDVDALAHYQDAYFRQLTSRSADLLVSFLGDAGSRAVYYETQSPVVRNLLWNQIDLCNGGGGVDGSVEDVDGLELWGPHWADNANRFSLVGEPGGTSVWSWAGGASVPYVSQVTIYTAVQGLGFAGNPWDVDVDALTLWDLYDQRVWSAGDTLIFSIRASWNWDGGEIVVLPFGGAAYFLDHGGHLWNTGFDVQGSFGVDTEEVDAIEAARVKEGEIQFDRLPSVSQWGLLGLVVLLIATGTVLMLRRRQVLQTQA